MQINNFKKIYILPAFAFALFFIAQNYIFAADTIPTQIPDLDEQVDITADPKYPGPNEDVTVTIDAYGIDLNNSNIVWTSNGKTVLQGKGVKTLNTTTGNQGQITTITATINPPNSKQIVRSVTINPQSVDILWEAMTYTPPFYKGKAMFSQEENVKFVAMPNIISNNGTLLNSNNLIYKWMEGGEVQNNKSGTGKNTFAYKGSILLKPVEIALETTDGSGIVAKDYIALAPLDPEVYIYEKSALYGTLFNRDLSSIFDMGTNQEGTISIYPFFYGISGRDASNLTYSWSINGDSIDVPKNQNDMTFRNTQNVEGRSQVGITVTNDNNFLQEVPKSTIINFHKPNSGFSF